MKKISVLYLMLAITFTLSAQAKYFNILPQPQEIQIKSGSGVMGKDLKFISVDTEGINIPILGPLLSALAQTDMYQGVGVKLSINPDLAIESDEGYTLEVSSRGVNIVAKSDAGLFYGRQTLEQLLEDSRDANKKIPALTIIDYPTIAYRSIQLDTKNHLDRTEYYYRMIDKLAKYKINGIIWEVEDKLRYTRRPEIAAPNAITKEEMLAISNYAKERFIEISPLIQGLGHADFILKHHWELRENPNSDWEFCPSDPRTYELQFDLYTDALEAFPHGKYLHIGGDEIGAIGIDKRCKATGKSGFELQMMWLKKVCDFAVDHDRVPIFWDDMPLKNAGLWPMVLEDHTQEELDKVWSTEKLDEAIALFPKECIYMRWNYDNPTHLPHRQLLEWYSSKGLKVMGATAAADGGSPVMPRHNSKVADIKGFSQLVAENNLEGILATSWDDGSPHLETVWRGFIAQAEFGWNPTGRTVEEYIGVHGQREFGFVPSAKRTGFISQLEDALSFYDGALVVEGRRNPAWGTTTFKLMGLPNANNPGEWSKVYSDKIVQAKLEEQNYLEIKNYINVALAQALRNRYTLQIYQQINELQHFPTELILALDAYDNSTSDNKKEALEHILKVCQGFESMRANLENVYGKTRFLNQPDGFIEEKNHHNHLAAKTLNSDWMYLYELPMISKTRQWASSLLKK